MDDEEVLSQGVDVLELGWAVGPLAAEGEKVRAELEVELAGSRRGLPPTTGPAAAGWLVAGRRFGPWAWCGRSAWCGRGCDRPGWQACSEGRVRAVPSPPSNGPAAPAGLRSGGVRDGGCDGG